jgi:transcriptional regulator with XRE-family HTH domain
MFKAILKLLQVVYTLMRKVVITFMSLGRRLKDARKSKKLTQTDVANILGIDDTTISKYENDKSEPDNETTKRLAILYGVKVSWLVVGQSEENEQKPLTEEENELLESFSKLNEEDQDYILQMAKRLSKE